MSERDPDYEYAELIETESAAEEEARQTRGYVFAAQVRVALGWIDLEVNP